MPFYDLAGRTAKELFAGVTTQTFWGDKMLVSRVTFAPDVVVPEHTHPHEQFGVILTGDLELTVGGETMLLRPGDMYMVPGGVAHSAKAGPEGFTAAEVFSPVRDDLKY